MIAEIGATQKLARFAANLKFNDIPPKVVTHAKLCVLDTLGCGLWGSTLPWTRKVAQLAEAEHAAELSSIWGMPLKTSAALAALVNGTAAHSFELDDLHKESIVHLGSVALSAGLAVAQREGGISGMDLITALVAGYEVGARVGMAAGTAHLRQGFHPTGTCGTFASAAAAGRVLGLNSQAMLHALGIAGTRGSGLLAAQYGAMTKRLHAGYAAQSGVYGADLAAQGFTGAETIVEEPYGGFLSSMAEGGNPQKLGVDAGAFELLRVGFKPYACCGSIHTTLDALLDLMVTYGFAAEVVTRVKVMASGVTVHHVGWPYRPAGVTAAQMNLAYCVAVTLLDGECFVDQFADRRLIDPAVIALAGRVNVEEDPAITALGPDARHHVKIEVTLSDGRILFTERRHARGSDSHPLDVEEVRRKFRLLAGKVLSPDQVQVLEERVAHLEELDPKEIGCLV